MRGLSAIFGKLALLLYGLGFAVLVLAHLYATYLAYQYVHAWRASRGLMWVVVTFFVPVLSTLYWLVVHWLQSGVFWNWLTLACVSGIVCFVCGMLSELLERASAK
jgi:hypothetical protein